MTSIRKEFSGLSINCVSVLNNYSQKIGIDEFLT